MSDTSMADKTIVQGTSTELGAISESDKDQAVASRKAALGAQAVSKGFHNASECEISVRITRDKDVIVFISMNATDPENIRMGLLTFKPEDAQALQFFDMSLGLLINYYRTFNKPAGSYNCNTSQYGLSAQVFNCDGQVLRVCVTKELVRFTILPKKSSSRPAVYFDFQKDESELLQRFKTDFTETINDTGFQLPVLPTDRSDVAPASTAKHVVTVRTNLSQDTVY